MSKKTAIVTVFVIAAAVFCAQIYWICRQPNDVFASTLSESLIGPIIYGGGTLWMWLWTERAELRRGLALIVTASSLRMVINVVLRESTVSVPVLRSLGAFIDAFVVFQLGWVFYASSRMSGGTESSD